MPDDAWVVLREHIMNPSLLPIDGVSVVLLALEAELHKHGIEAGFDPSRPGEALSWTRSVAQPFRLLVKQADFAQAQEIALALEDEIAAAPEFDDHDLEFDALTSCEEDEATP